MIFCALTAKEKSKHKLEVHYRLTNWAGNKFSIFTRECAGTYIEKQLDLFAVRVEILHYKPYTNMCNL